MLRRVICGSGVLLALALAGGVAQAQEPRLVGRLSDAARAQVDTILESARRDGLPSEPLVDRALEGASKGATGPRIVTAVQRLEVELRAAQQRGPQIGRVGGRYPAHPALRRGLRVQRLLQVVIGPRMGA